MLSASGICYNTDRLKDLGIGRPPATWEDLCDPLLVFGLADPTKSASVSGSEMIIHTQCARAVADAGSAVSALIRLYEEKRGPKRAGGRAASGRASRVPVGR